METTLLQKLLTIRSPSGNEQPMHDFILGWLHAEQDSFRAAPKIFEGEGFQDCIAVVFGEPRTAFFAHMDTVGYMVRYGQELIEIGSPEGAEGDILWGEDEKGLGEAILKADSEHEWIYTSGKRFQRGTELAFAPKYSEDGERITSPYLDNRIGIWNLLEMAKTLENGLLAFTCWEEHHGGSAAVMARFGYEQYGITQTVISDVTYVTEGIVPGGGVAISMRDAGIPRRSYVQKVIEIARKSNVPFQLEVEGGGSSDGNEIQRIPYPVDWCFVGAPCENMHSPRETVLKEDVKKMHELYRHLAKGL